MLSIYALIELLSLFISDPKPKKKFDTKHAKTIEANQQLASPSLHDNTQDEFEEIKPKDKKGKQQKKPAPKEEDELDLFGSDGEETAEAKEALKKAAEASKKPKKAPPVAKSLVIWEVKPYDADTDLNELGKKIIANVQMDGLAWKTEFKLEPVAFGIKKIIIGAAIEDAKVSTDDVQEEIEEMDEVQSVDIAAFNKL